MKNRLARRDGSGDRLKKSSAPFAVESFPVGARHAVPPFAPSHARSCSGRLCVTRACLASWAGGRPSPLELLPRKIEGTPKNTIPRVNYRLGVYTVGGRSLCLVRIGGLRLRSKERRRPERVCHPSRRLTYRCYTRTCNKQSRSQISSSYRARVWQFPSPVPGGAAAIAPVALTLMPCRGTTTRASRVNSKRRLWGSA
jgi:hypothetical protein